LQGSWLISCSGDCASGAWPSHRGRPLDSSATSSVSDTFMHRAPQRLTRVRIEAPRGTEHANQAKPTPTAKPPIRGKSKPPPLDTTSRLIEAPEVRLSRSQRPFPQPHTASRKAEFQSLHRRRGSFPLRFADFPPLQKPQGWGSLSKEWASPRSLAHGLGI